MHEFEHLNCAVLKKRIHLRRIDRAAVEIVGVWLRFRVGAS